MKEISFDFKKHLDYIILFVFCACVFTYVIFFTNSDIPDHIGHILKINSTDTSYPPNFVFYFGVNLFSAFSSSKLLMYGVTVVLLSAASLAKYALSKSIILDLNRHYVFEKGKLTLLALGLFLCFAIPDPYSVLVLKKMYLGRLAPIAWHNSTTIMVFPFAIWLFWKQLKVFDVSYKATRKDIQILTLLVIGNILIKPSFIFVYIPVTFFFLLNKIKVEGIKRFLFNLVPIITGGLFIVVQYFLIYFLQKGSIQEEPSSVVISAPFEAFSLFVPLWYLPVAFVLSLALPILSIILYREILKYKPFIYSLMLTVAGVALSACVMESGPRMLHGNFMWQNIICTFLLMLSTVSFLASRFHDLKSKRTIALLAVFLIHTLSGILYLVKMVLTTSYN